MPLCKSTWVRSLVSHVYELAALPTCTHHPLQVKKELAALEEQVAPLVVQYNSERGRLDEIRGLQTKREQVGAGSGLHPTCGACSIHA